MNAVSAALREFARASQSALQIGVGMLLQAGILLLAGLFAGHALVRCGPSTRLFVYRCVLAGIWIGMIGATVMPGHISSRWSVTLPSASAGSEQVVSAGV